MSPSPTAPPSPQGALRLADWGVIRAQGPEAAKFLHGQLTQDVEHLAPGAARLAGYCSAKGRLLATFVVWRRGDDDLLLACSADLLPAALKRLSMYVLRAKCKLSDASADSPLWGLAGESARQALGADGLTAVWSCRRSDAGDAIRLPDAVADGVIVPRYLWAGAEPPLHAAIDTQAWAWLEVMSGTARVVAATVEHFVPQMVNLELVGGVDFQKGCYPGQEIVARSQYRGTLKRRAYVVTSAAPLRPGQEVFHSADPGQPAGLVVLAGSLAPGRHAGLVELKMATLRDGTLHAGAADGPLVTPLALPYPLPAEAA